MRIITTVIEKHISCAYHAIKGRLNIICGVNTIESQMNG